MALNIVMVVKDRPDLTHQSLYTLAKHTSMPYNVTLIDDGSNYPTRQILDAYSNRRNVALLSNHSSRGIIGQVKNLGVYWAERFWGRGDWLYLSDNDVYFTPGWDVILLAAAELVCGARYGYWLLGGQNHPFHRPISENKIDGYTVHEFFAVAGTSQLMRWEAWDKYGPMAANAPGMGQSEDTAFCNRIRAAGGKVGAVSPAVVYDTGITQTDGVPSVGAEIKERHKGVVYQ